jgi:hypothetical protein
VGVGVSVGGIEVLVNVGVREGASVFVSVKGAMIVTPGTKVSVGG